MMQKSFILLIFFLFLGCENEQPISAPVSSVTFRGVLGSDLSQHHIGKGIGDIGDISQIIACAVDENGNFNPDRTQTTPVGTDGSFSIDLPSDAEWVLMTSNPDATTLEGRIGNFISLSEDNNTRLTSLPMFNASGEIDAGFLNALADETISSTMISQLESSFGINTNSLLELAHVDVLSKFVKNNYLNTDTNTGITFTYTLSYGLVKVDNNYSVSYNQFSDPLQYTINPVIWLVIRTNHPDVTSDKTFYIVHPNDSNITISSGYDNGWIQGFLYTSEPKTGFYKVNDENNATLAIFDFAGVDIVENGNVTGILPSIRLNVDDDNTTRSVSLSLYTFDQSTNNYVKILDPTIAKRYLNLAWMDQLAAANVQGDGVFCDLNFKNGTYIIYDGASQKSYPLSFINGEYRIDFGRNIADISNNIAAIRFLFFIAGNIEYSITYTLKP